MTSSAVLVGHSANCPVVAEAATRSDAVVGLVLVGPVTDRRARTWPRMIGQWLRTAAHERAWETGVLAPQYAKVGLRSIVTGMSSTRRYRTDVALSAVTVPTVVVRGQHDRVAPARWCAALSRTPGVELVTVPGGDPLTGPGAPPAARRRP